jgi:hypothetical protein
MYILSFRGSLPDLAPPLRRNHMKKLTIVLFTVLALTVAALAGAAGTKGTWTGWVTDEHCGAKGAIKVESISPAAGK